MENKSFHNVTNNESLWGDYDYPNSFTTEELMELIPTTIIYSIIFLIGLIGNSLIIFVIARYRRMRSISNIFLASLSAADLLLIIACIPVKLARLYSFTWTMGEACCKVVYYIQSLSAICSVLTLTAISIERFYAIVYPMKAKFLCTTRNARVVIISIWMLSVLMAVPTIYVRIHLKVGGGFVVGYWCVPDWDNLPLWRCYEWYMLISLLVVPGLVMSISYTIVCFRVCTVMRQRSSMTPQSSTSSSRHSIKNRNKGLMSPASNNTDSYMLNPVGSNDNKSPVQNNLTVNQDNSCLGRRSRSSDENNTLKQASILNCH
ncbi:QRFP-like peptide receptor [Nymphon striatum]|nr:QRFP-like peptide receptor [Nymphon striatum]